jgi:hypothetical protein
MRRSKKIGAEAAAASGNCEELRRRLELCTQHASTRLLHAAVMPPADGSSCRRKGNGE